MKAFFVFLFSTLISASIFAHSHHKNYDPSWKIVPNETVCMVTEAHFDKPQIPVAVAGKTYYGCCEGCKKTLAEDPKARTAIDPLTKKSIDKATAVIATNAAGKVMYFENKKNFEKYMKGSHENQNQSRPSTH